MLKNEIKLRGRTLSFYFFFLRDFIIKSFILVILKRNF